MTQVSIMYWCMLYSTLVDKLWARCADNMENLCFIWCMHISKYCMHIIGVGYDRVSPTLQSGKIEICPTRYRTSACIIFWPNMRLNTLSVNKCGKYPLVCKIHINCMHITKKVHADFQKWEFRIPRHPSKFYNLYLAAELVTHLDQCQIPAYQ